LKKLSLIFIALLMLVACGEAEPHLDRIKDRGELNVLTRYGLTSYYVKNDQLAGFEYELASAFAKRLNVKLNIIVPDNLNEMLKMIKAGKADIAAAGLTITPERKQKIRFGPVYHEVTQQLVYRRGTNRPSDITDLGDGQLEVVAGSSHVEQLQALKKEVPNLKWTENHQLDSNGLLELVELEMIDYTIADSNEVEANQVLFPELRVAFDVSEPQPLGWALPKDDDDSLFNELSAFFAELEASGDLDRLIEKYYGHIKRFDYVDTRAIHRRILTHLPKYETLFQQAAADNDFDWRLLAAMSYQESHWNPKAISSTGVRGLMMLTQATAKQLGVTNRRDPKQSVSAGAKYLDSIRDRLPKRIQEPDRTWFALAAYNIGLGHLEDARVLTERGGKNPDLWGDVAEFLPLLSKKKWFSQVKHGYARGTEPVRYVENIRRYYDILLHQKYGNEVLGELPEQIDSDVKQAVPAAL
jgi:membrane-bound lytic murein transglycosylase F